MECEATYHDDKSCPPLIGLAKLESLDLLTSRDQRKLGDLKAAAKDA